MFQNINIINELQELNADTLITLGRKNIFFVPDDYFINLSNNIITQIWLNSVSKKNPYSLPLDYFKNLPEIIIDKVTVNSTASLSNNLYSAPDGYFNTLAENILEKIKVKNNNVQQELEEVAPLLSKLPKTNVYTVPAGYFETLVPQTTPKAQPAKVISIGSKARKWFTYAAAACIAALLFGGGYYYLNGNKPSADNKTAINKYADIKVAQAISQLSDDEIDSYLNNDNSEIYVPPQDDSQDVNIKMLLENVSDEEINNYLLENSDPGENTKGS